jgi:anti-anti-sigma factor
MNAEALFEEEAIRELSVQLRRLIEEGYTRLVLNFGRVRTMSSDVLATLARLHQHVKQARGSLGLYGLDPVLVDMLRICHLEQLLAIYADETEALGSGSATADRPQRE